MKTPDLPTQAAMLHEIQKAHAQTLIETGVAQSALRRRFDDEWFQDAATTTDGSEVMPVVMIDDSSPDSTNLYVHLVQSLTAPGIPGSEISIATIQNAGSPEEMLVPEVGFSMEDVRVVRALVDELSALRSSVLPDLSSDLLAIYSGE